MGVVGEVVEPGMLTFSLGVTLTVAQLLRKRVALVGAPSRQMVRLVELGLLA
jgi:hypothetical protein